MATVILGLNAYHGDSAACVLVDGELVAAAEEERFRRVKHWAGFPSEAIEYCLNEAGLKLHDINHAALNRDPKANIARRLAFMIRQRPSPRLVRERISNMRAWLSVEEEFARAFRGQTFSGELHRVEHHLAHLASAFLVSPYREAVVLSVDGFGDFASTAWGYGRDASLTLDGRIYFPHSLGAFYQAITQFLGFPHYGDEYKMMGLAPYGRPAYVAALQEVVASDDDGAFRLNLTFFRHHRESTSYQWNNQSPHADALYSDELAELLGPPRLPEEELLQHHKDIACSAQVVYENAFFHLLNTLHGRYGCDAIAIAGGCGQNSVANGKIHLRSPFKRSYLPPAAPDAGGAIGAAAHVWHSLNSGLPRTVSDDAFVGPSFSASYIESLLGEHRGDLEARGCTVAQLHSDADLCQRAAAHVAGGKVVGWFQGRMELGPRALGNRSIVCDPRRPDMKGILNRKIKRRESFRPFAPSVLRSAVSEWFESEADVPFMSKVFMIREEKRPLIPAVTHVDGSGRLQTVDEATNPRYFALIAAFHDLTQVPMVLNTSFNENEPIVCRPEEALDCFLRTEMDVLVLNDTLIERPS